MENFTIMYVEDDTVAQEWMKLMLEDDVKELFQAFNGQEGLDMYKEFKPDIILTDISMPILDGLSMSEEIKKINKEQPIIVMSAFNDKDTLLRAINIGINNFITKPIDIEKLMEKLEEIVQALKCKLDIKKSKEEKIKKLYGLAHYDNLTNIYNRFFFEIKLDEIIFESKANNKVFSLLFIDLDDFKIVNDTYGHMAGDKILKFVTSNIQKIIKPDDIFARLGGDEFVIIVRDTDDKEYLDKLASTLLDSISESIEYDENKFNVTGSIGISRFPVDGDVRSAILHSADLAMYEAKNLGKSAYCYAT